MICGQTVYETDHPRFFIIKPSENGLFYFSKTKVNLFNMDPTTYVNTKIVFVERHLQRQLTSLYADVIVQRCTLEQQVLRNLQTLAVTAPMEFAYAKIKQPGYMAVNHGELVHVIQCNPVEVQVRNTERCYHELPVTYMDSLLFMAPRTHVLQKYGTEIGCNPFLFPAYKLGNKWYKVSHTLHEIPTPEVMEPNNENRWTYVSPGNLFQGGIYSQEDMEDLRQHIIIPTERKAVSNILTETMIYDIAPLISEHTIKGWVQGQWDAFWNWFPYLGSLTGGCLAMFFVVRALKFVIDTIVHGVVLFELFGWSVRLIGAVWDSVTMFCVHSHALRHRDRQFASGSAGVSAEETIPLAHASEQKVTTEEVAEAHNPAFTLQCPRWKWHKRTGFQSCRIRNFVLFYYCNKAGPRKDFCSLEESVMRHLVHVVIPCEPLP
ncbi:uncharacterized protein [Onthophagus taurus]|uniref:uncharacterized protein n=1 Tax=Onthophagus taurus TaxID=166361 RepID=UPI0039BE4808